MATRLLLLCCLSTLGCLPAAEAGTDSLQHVLDEGESDESLFERRRELAADYRLERERLGGRLTERYQEGGRAGAAFVGRLLERGAIAEAKRSIRRLQRQFGYSDAASLLQHQLLRCHLATGNGYRAKIALIDLVERFPAYADIGSALQEALLVAKHLQATGPLIDTRARHPDDIIQEEYIGQLERANVLFRYLAQVGDRQSVAPEAALHFARSQLVLGRGNRDRLAEARLAYEYLLDRFPDSPFVFRALFELAIAHLIGYRGDQYDVGALIHASSVIAKARVYIGDDPQRQQLITTIDELIVHWHQERDLQVARWYRDRDQLDAARLYYRQARRHDPASKAGLAAERELDRLSTAE